MRSPSSSDPVSTPDPGRPLASTNHRSCAHQWRVRPVSGPELRSSLASSPMDADPHAITPSANSAEHSLGARPAVFLDRDDTIIACREIPPAPPPANPGDLCDPALVRLLPGVRRACFALRDAGFVLVVVSNQGAVARGAIPTSTVDAINERVRQLLDAPAGSEPRRPSASLIQSFYYCPYHPQGRVPEYTREHPWRKPQPGMILAAARDLRLDLNRSWLVGDAPRDVEAGIRAGLRPDRCLLVGPDAPLPSLAAAAAQILGRALESDPSATLDP